MTEPPGQAGPPSSHDDLLREDERHPGPEAIAALLDPETIVPDRESLRAHLASCRRCFGLYAELAQVELGSRWDADASRAPKEWIDAAKRLPLEPEGAVSVAGSTARAGALPPPETIGWPRWAAAAAVVVAVIASGWIWSASRERQLLAPVRSAVADVSRTGMVMSEGVSPPGPVLRGAGPSDARKLAIALDELARRHDRRPGSEEWTYWLAAGMLAEGDGGARAILADGLARFPDSRRLANLGAVALYRDHRDEEADRELVAILARWPDDPVALFNRALLMKEMGRDADLQALRTPLLRAIRHGSALEARARLDLF